MIYFQEIVATISVDEGDENLIFARSAATLVENALKRGLKEINKFAIKNRVEGP